ncbi:hypothetical protein [Sphingobacterium sp. NPDC055431]
MKTLSLIFLFLLCSKSHGQIDSSLIYKKADHIIKLIENKNIDSLISNSTDSIRCILCNEAGIKNYIDSKIFFTERVQEIFTPTLISKIKSAPKSIVRQSEPYLSYIVYYKIIAKDEIAPGHEGVDFGIWLRSDDLLKFNALDTIP